MNKTTLAALCALAVMGMGGAAHAADLPMRSAPPQFVPPPAIPAFSWTGGYVGLQAGYQFGRSNTYAYDNTIGPYGGLASAGDSGHGFVGGGHIGYLFSTQSIPVLNQLTGATSNLPVIGGLGGAGGVFGIEGDVDGSTYTTYQQLGSIGAYGSERLQGSIRGRLGFAVDRALFYATGGASFGELRQQYVDQAFTGGRDFYDRTKVGYTVGGGVEYAFSNTMSARLEYRFTKYPAFTSTLYNAGAGITNVRQNDSNNRVQAGISYKFNGLDSIGSLPGAFTAPFASR